GRLEPVAALGQDLQLGVLRDGAANPLTSQGLVIDDQGADVHRIPPLCHQYLALEYERAKGRVRLLPISKKRGTKSIFPGTEVSGGAGPPERALGHRRARPAGRSRCRGRAASRRVPSSKRRRT